MTTAESDTFLSDAGETGEIDAMQVLLIDPSPLSRSCLVAGFAQHPGIAIIACGQPDELAEPLFALGGPDIVVVQAAGQDLESIEFGRRLQSLARRFPEAARMLLSGPDDGGRMLAGLQSGFNAYITDGLGLEATVQAMQLVRQGMIVYPRDVLRMVKDQANGDPAVPHNGADMLTPRQEDVLRLLARGLSNKAIATELYISESTVKVHIRAIMERTGMLNRTQIVAHFFRDRK